MPFSFFSSHSDPMLEIWRQPTSEDWSRLGVKPAVWSPGWTRCPFLQIKRLGAFKLLPVLSWLSLPFNKAFLVHREIRTIGYYGRKGPPRLLAPTVYSLDEKWWRGEVVIPRVGG